MSQPPPPGNARTGRIDFATTSALTIELSGATFGSPVKPPFDATNATIADFVLEKTSLYLKLTKSGTLSPLASVPLILRSADDPPSSRRGAGGLHSGGATVKITVEGDPAALLSTSQGVVYVYDTHGSCRIKETVIVPVSVYPPVASITVPLGFD